MMSNTTDVIPDVTTKLTTPRNALNAYRLYQIYAILHLVFVIIGLVGNSISAFVLLKMDKTHNGLKLLKYLTFVDSLMLLLGYVDFALGFENVEKNIVDTIRLALIPIVHPLGVSVYLMEIYLTVCIALQRCLAVARPLHHSRFMEEHFLHKLMIGIIISSLVYNIPHWVAFPPKIVFDTNRNMTMLRNDRSEFGKTFGYVVVYNGWMTLLVRTIIPLTILIISNIILIICMRRNAEMRSEMTSGQSGRKPGKTTAVILAITSMSILTHSTTAAVQILMAVWENSTNRANEAFVLFSTLLITINGSTNFIFYFTFGEKFRHTLVSMCCKK